jgi:glycosyltransferase involved in cell wall biosynthesis
MISVVIATYNGEKYIEEQLRSVFLQTLSADEVLIFDDGSTDGTTQIVQSFIEKNNCNGWKLFLNSENLGYCKNFLNGVLNAKGDYIFLADQDDVWHPEKLEVMVNTLRADDEIEALCCSCDLIDGDGKTIQNPGNIGVLFSENDGSIEEFSPENFIGHSFIRGCSVGFKREILSNILPIELKGLLSHDWLITFTAALQGKCALINRVLMNYRCHSSNTSFGQRKQGASALQKRIDAVKNSINGHWFILDNFDCYRFASEELKQDITDQIVFEQKRVDYLENGGFIRLMKCLVSISKYRCYHKNFLKGVKVFLGDVSYRKNRKKL